MTIQRSQQPPGAPLAVGILAISVISAAAGAGNGSGVVILAAGLAGALISLALWRSDELPILLVPALYQWCQVALKPLQSGFLGMPLNRLSDYGGDLGGAALFGLAGVLALSLGMQFGSGAPPSHRLASLGNEIRKWPRDRVVMASFALIAVGHILNFASNFAGGARQLLLTLEDLRYAGLFILAIWSLSNRKDIGYLVAAVGLEVVLGITGFFADFRSQLLVLFAAALAVSYSTKQSRIRISEVFSLTAIVILAVGLAAFWSEIKPNYRAFVNSGSGAQEVNRPIGERVAFLLTLTEDFGPSQFGDGLTRLTSRLSYIDFLSMTMQRVPASLPHEDGARVGRAIIHILTPRILFPNKADTQNDSEVTALYTGLPIFVNVNTSISIGYLGELYVDFGYIGALSAVSAMGYLIGFGYKTIRDRAQYSMCLNYALCVTVIVPLFDFGTALIKIVGGVTSTLLVALLVQRVFLPPLSRWLSDRSQGPSGMGSGKIGGSSVLP